MLGFGALVTRVRTALQMRRMPAFFNLLNLWEIVDGVLVGVDLQFTRVYRLGCPDALFFSDQEASQHAVGIARLLNSLPPNCTAQLLVKVRWNGEQLLDQYAAVERPKGKMLDFILSERIGFLKKIPFRRVEHFLAITTHPTTPDLESLRARPAALRLPEPTSAPLDAHARRLQELGTICNNVLASLREAKVTAQPLSEQELRDYLFERLNPGTAADSATPTPRPELTLRVQLALNACQTGFDTMTMDGHHHRGINLHLRPVELDGRAMHVLYNDIPGNYDLAIAVHSLDQERAEKSLKATAAAAVALEGLHITRYHEAALLTKDADDLLAHTKAGDQRLFLSTVHVVMRDTDPTVLTQHHEAALQAFRRLEDAVAIVDDMNHLPLFLSSLPAHSHLNQRVHAVHTDVAARLLTASASWDGHAHPQVVFPCDDGKVIGVDLFASEIPVKHSLILGVSGEGKSVLGNTILTSFYAAHQDNHVIVIDDGGSYRRLCEILGGQYLEPTLDGAYSFNPFLSREYAFTAENELDADFLSFMKLLVQLMVHRTEMSNNEKSIIEKCVLAAYKIAEGDIPLLGDLRTAFEQFDSQGDAADVNIARSFYKDLALWTTGSYGRLLNRRSTFDASSRFVVFDLTKMTQEDLKPVLLLIIKSVIHPKLANKTLRKIIALDEVWKFLKDKNGADLVTEWYKTGRKFNTAVTVMTQSAGDLLKSAAAEAIAENSTVKWILNLGGGYEKLTDLKLTAEEIAHIRALGNNAERSKYRKVFLRFGDRKTIIRNVLSPTAYWLYTTDPQDLLCELALRKREPKWPNVQVLKTLGLLKDANPTWSVGDFLKAIGEGRY